MRGAKIAPGSNAVIIDIMGYDSTLQTAVLAKQAEIGTDLQFFSAVLATDNTIGSYINTKVNDMCFTLAKSKKLITEFPNMEKAGDPASTH